MTKKKNGFFTLVFSILPGAGQMYMGFMKRGISLMGTFMLLIFIASWINFGPVLYLLPIIWFYAFFDTHNLRSMSDEEFYSLEDGYILFPEFLQNKGFLKRNSNRTILAIILICIGISVLWNNFIYIINMLLPDRFSYYASRLGGYLIQFMIGSAIVVIGIYLIRGKKLELDKIIKPSNSYPEKYNDPTVTILDAEDFTKKEDFNS